MAAAILIVLVVLVLALLAAAILYVLGIRSESATVRAAARRFHHGVGNPVQLRSAGTPGTFASVIRHRGRRTGRSYQTPVWAVPTEDGFVIAIVYGSGTDWLKNVLASGAAAIVHQGETYPRSLPWRVLGRTSRPRCSEPIGWLASRGVCGFGGSQSPRPPPPRVLGLRDRRSWAGPASTGAIGAGA
jgi:deazaflavin-dependent oxidoreductase (nitroreductase family)